MTSTDPPADPDRAARPDPPRASVSLGKAGEDLAERYLLDRGMSVIERNWRCEHGEVDVVAVDGACLVICEVKTRRSVAFGEPVEAVTHAKAARLRRLAAAYVRDHETGCAAVRVDVLGILFAAGLLYVTYEA